MGSQCAQFFDKKINIGSTWAIAYLSLCTRHLKLPEARGRDHVQGCLIKDRPNHRCRCGIHGFHRTRSPTHLRFILFLRHNYTSSLPLHALLSVPEVFTKRNPQSPKPHRARPQYPSAPTLFTISNILFILVIFPLAWISIEYLQWWRNPISKSSLLGDPFLAWLLHIVWPKRTLTISFWKSELR